MKTRFLVLAGAALLLASGCTDANSETEPASTNAVAPAPADSAIVATTNAAPVAAKPMAEDEAVPAGEPVNIVATPPPTIKLSPSAGEITKLVQAGVDSHVILAYVTNSPNTFRLEADDIVYLKDLGMSSDLVTAMIQHDQRIKDAALTAATVTSPSTPTQPVSVWTAGMVGPSNGAWNTNEPAPAAEPSTATTVPPPPTEEVPAPETVNYFYDSLAPYGTWVDVAGYGRCWRPTAVVTTPGWRPYSHSGRWEWTDSGWYWYSDYSWGWAPFHYGRWFSHPRWGWCWVPGSEWGPSWVSWRYSDAYCGWSPLPPAACYSPSIGFTYYGRSCGSSFSFGLTWDCFTFVAYNNFHSHHYDRDCVPHHQAGVVYNNTTVVNNIIRGNNNTIINQGVAPAQIASHGGAPIKQVPIRDGRWPRGGQAIRHEEIAHDGHINVIRPSIPTGHGHTTVKAGDSPAKGGAQGLNMGNAAATAPATPQAGLNPPRNGGSGPRHPVQTIGGSSTPTAPTTAQAPAPASPTEPGTAGPRPPAHGNGSFGANPTTPNTQNEGTHGALIIRTPRTPRGTKENSATPGNGIAQPATQATTPSATAPPAPSAPVVASTPGPTRPTRTPATPWLNNTPTAPVTTPIKAPQVAEQSVPTRSIWTMTRDTRNGNTGNAGNNTPSQVAPTVRSTPSPTYQAPAYQAPSAPTRVFGAPAAPQKSQPYSAPVRSAPERYTPPSQPSYTPPTREAAPSRSVSPSPSPSPAPRSEPRSSPSSSSSSSKGSDSSKDDRSSRGR